VGAGGWALLNELAYLRRHGRVLNAMNRIVFVVNSDDFGEPAHWSSDLSHPRSRPWSVALWALSRYSESPAYVEMPPSGRNWLVELCELLQSYSGTVLMFLYPTRSEFSEPALRKERLDNHGDKAIALLKKNLAVASIANDPLWTLNLYRDDIHPTATGNATLARIIAKYIEVGERLKKQSVGRPERS
jgi:hypothetical protein